MNPEKTIGDLVADYQERTERGEQVSLAELCADHPEWLVEVKDKIRYLNEILADAPEATEDSPRSAPSPAAIPIPTIPGFEILGILGQGGMGVVYKARQVKLKRIVALKMVLSGVHARPEELARFRKEAEAVARLQHPNIVQIYEIGEHEGRHYLVLEFVDGETLAQKLEGRLPRPPRESAELLEILARAMHLAHERGIVHRDLKPGNVLLTKDGTPKIADFGLAKQLDADQTYTQTGAIVGTPSYMAPEQAAGKTKDIGRAADVYALGAILYQLVTGRLPFLADTPMGTLRLVVDQDPVSAFRLQPNLPRDLDTICMKCLEKDPRKRYATSEDLAADLHRFLAGEPIKARPTGRLERVWRWARRNPLVASLAAFVAVLVLGAFTTITWLWLDATDARREADSANYANGVQLAEARLHVNDVEGADDALARCPPALRGWEWHYLKRQCHSELVVCANSTGVLAVAFSADGRRLASSDQGMVKLWDADTGREIAAFPAHEKDIWSLAFSPNGRLLATASEDHTIAILDAATGLEHARLKGHELEVTWVAFSPKGQLLASASKDKTVRIWDVADGKTRYVLSGHSDQVNCVAFHPKDQRLLSASNDRTIRLWDLDSKKELKKFDNHQLKVISVAFDPVAGSRIVSAGQVIDPRLARRSELKVWNATTGELPKDLPGSPAGIRGIFFDASGDRFVAAFQDNTLRIFNAVDGAEVGVLRGRSPFFCVAWSPDRRRIAGGGEDKKIRVYDADPEKIDILRTQRGQFPFCMAFSAEEEFLAAGYGDGTTAVWKLDRRTKPLLLPASKIVHSVAFSPNGKNLVSGGRDKSAHIWDVTTGKETAPPLVHPQHVSAVAYSRDGNEIVTGCEDGAVRFWSADKGVLLRTFTGHTKKVFSVAIHPFRPLLASGGIDHRVVIWNLDTGEAEKSLTTHTDEVTSVAFSPDGSYLASASGTSERVAIVWNTRTWQPVATCRGHSQKINCVAFSPDGQRLVSTSDDGTVRFWEPKTGRMILALRDHQASVNCVSFSRGHRMATGSFDQTIRLWDGAPWQP